MIRQVLATTVFAAGTLLAGVALAQPRMVTRIIPPVAYVGNGGHVGNGGYVGPRYTEQVPVAEAAPAVPAAGEQAQRTSWNSPTGGIQAANPTAGQVYTFALNDLSANDFRRVHHLWMDNGQVSARAMTPYHVDRVVRVNPDTGEITTG